MTGMGKCCALCSLRVYGLWVANEPHPVGCSDGLDATPDRCSHVLASIALGVIRVDYLGADLLPHHLHLKALIGADRYAEIEAHVRAHHIPPKAGKMREPDYSRPTVN